MVGENKSHVKSLAFARVSSFARAIGVMPKPILVWFDILGLVALGVEQKENGHLLKVLYIDSIVVSQCHRHAVFIGVTFGDPAVKLPLSETCLASNLRMAKLTETSGQISATTLSPGQHQYGFVVDGRIKSGRGERSSARSCKIDMASSADRTKRKPNAKPASLHAVWVRIRSFSLAQSHPGGWS